MRERVVTFSGLDTESSPTGRPTELLQTATNVRLDQAGVVQQRRGWERVLQANLSRDGVAVAGFVTASGAYALAGAYSSRISSTTAGVIYTSAFALLYTGSQGAK